MYVKQSVLFCTLTSCCVVELLNVPVDTISRTVLALQNHLYSPCILLLHFGEQDMKYDTAATQMQTLLSSRGVASASVSIAMTNDSKLAAENCNGRPLYVFTSSGAEVQQFLQQVSASLMLIHTEVAKATLSSARWLLFLDNDISGIQEYFIDVNIPMDCDFLVLQSESDSVAVITEVYRVSPSHPLQSHRLHNATSLSLYRRRNNLQGLVLRSAVQNFSPLLKTQTIEGQKTVRISGYYDDVWKTFEEKLNFSTRFYMPPDKSWGTELPNHTWDGVVGLLVRRETDVSSVGLITTQARLGVVDFLFPTLPTRTSVYIKKPGKSTNWDNFLHPFSYALWKTILVAIPVISVVLTASWNLIAEASNVPLWYIVYESTFRICGNFCNQGFDMKFKSTAGRLIILTSYLTTTVLLAAYSAALISFLTVQEMKLPFTNFRELLTVGDYKLETTPGTAFLTFFQDSPDPLIKELYRKLIYPNLRNLHPMSQVGLVKLCNKYKSSYFTSEIVAETLRDSLPCTLVRIPGTIVSAPMGTLVTKNSPYRRILNYHSKQLFWNGVLKRLYLKMFPERPDVEDPTYQELDFQAMSPLLSVLATGIVASILVFVLETAVHRLSSGTQKHVQVHAKQRQSKRRVDHTVTVRKGRGQAVNHRVDMPKKCT